MSTPTVSPVPSGAHLAPACEDRDVCDGLRGWDFPAGPVGGHCGCPKGRREAELDYARRHKQPAPATPDELLAAAS